MNLQPKCDCCQGFHSNIQQFYKCKHYFCKGCTIKNQQFGQCKICVESQQSAIKLRSPETSKIRIPEDSKQTTQSLIQSKKYSSPYEYKIETIPTLNYCAVCLFYLSDSQIKQQKKLKINSILDCKIHTLCLGCYTSSFTRQSPKTYYCEICTRMQ